MKRSAVAESDESEVLDAVAAVAVQAVDTDHVLSSRYNLLLPLLCDVA